MFSDQAPLYPIKCDIVYFLSDCHIQTVAAGGTGGLATVGDGVSVAGAVGGASVVAGGIAGDGAVAVAGVCDWGTSLGCVVTFGGGAAIKLEIHA